jgi:caffeoyl-CoA O-methyltransferase
MPLAITDLAIQHYAEAHTSAENSLLQQINRDTHAKVLMPRMLSGHLQGRVLSMISRMIKPKTILEIGTYTGYSALCLAEGLAPNGKIITLDVNEELEDRVRGYFEQSIYRQYIEYRIGHAAQIIPTLAHSFDLVFIDADKENNATYFDLLIHRLPLGAYMLIDNVLWSGKVLDDKPDKDTNAILAFNQKIQDDARVENVLLPIRDGLMLIQKINE